MDRKLIVDFLEEYRKFNPEIIERELKIEPSKSFISSIIGPRRAGKTYYLLYLRNKFKNPLYLNFEDPRLYYVKAIELNEIIRLYNDLYGNFPDILLLDEIQNLKQWHGVLRQIHDLKKYPMVVSGSSSKLLSKEIATALRGRSLSYLLLPFSFREFLKAKNIDLSHQTLDDISNIKKFLRNYMIYGGFPEIVKNEENKEKIIENYLDLVLFRDFIERYRIENIELARFLQNFLLQNFACEITVNAIYKKIKSSGSRVSKDTIYEYITKLEDTVMFFFLRRYSEKVHIREFFPKKVYLCDTGLSIYTKIDENLGPLMENIVFLELLRRKNEQAMMEIYYYKNNGYEIDFLVKQGLEVKELIQVTYASGFDEIVPREYRSLIRASELFKQAKLTIITWDYEDTRTIKWFGKEALINFVPLWKWLL